MARARSGLSRIERSDRPNGETTMRRATHEQHERDHEAVGVGDRAEDIEFEQAEERVHGDALQTIGAAGQPGRRFAISPENERHAERHHQPRQIGAPEHQEAGDEAEQPPPTPRPLAGPTMRIRRSRASPSCPAA